MDAKQGAGQSSPKLSIRHSACPYGARLLMEMNIWPGASGRHALSITDITQLYNINHNSAVGTRVRYALVECFGESITKEFMIKRRISPYASHHPAETLEQTLHDQGLQWRFEDDYLLVIRGTEISHMVYTGNYVEDQTPQMAQEPVAQEQMTRGDGRQEYSSQAESSQASMSQEQMAQKYGVEMEDILPQAIENKWIQDYEDCREREDAQRREAISKGEGLAKNHFDV